MQLTLSPEQTRRLGRCCAKLGRWGMPETAVGTIRIAIEVLYEQLHAKPKHEHEAEPGIWAGLL